MRVLFVCFGNACRSQMADVIARQEASDVMTVESAGLVPLGYVPELTTDTLKKNGYSNPKRFRGRFGRPRTWS
jgi:protein-tyrosine-phosphatase